MNEAAAALSLLTPGAVAGALVAAVWQGALLAALVWACLRLAPALGVPELPAAVRSTVWLGVFVLLVGLQVVPVMVHGQGAAAQVIRPVFHLDPRWSVALAVVWLTASVFRAVQLLQGVWYLRRLAADAKEVPQGADLAVSGSVVPCPSADNAEGWGARLRLFGRPVRLCTSEAIARPSVIGFFRPRVLIPAKLMAEMSPAELRQVLMHELEHLRRADDWTNLLQKVALVVFPLNPALAWVERRLCAERELACDDRVLAAGGGRKAYALCLTHLAEFALLERGFSLVLGAWERRPELVRRVHRILSAPARTMNRGAALGVSGGVLAAALAGAVVLARSPQLVSFAPVTVASAAEPDSGESGVAISHPSNQKPLYAWGTQGFASDSALRERMAKPRLVSASMKVEKRSVKTTPAVVSSQISSQVSNRRRSGAPGVVVAARRKAPVIAAEPEVKLAGLRMPPVPGGDTLLVMTEWNDLGTTQKMMVASLREGKGPAAAAVPAVYIVATPNGWLIVQI